QRNAVPVPGPLMDEVDADAVDIGPELFGRVQRALLGVPVELVGPIGEQLREVLQVSPLIPGGAWCGIRPARLADALSKVGQDLRLDLDGERSDVQGWFHSGRALKHA